MITMATEKTEKVKQGTAYFVREDSDAPGGTCQYEHCPLSNPSIYSGMTLVSYGGKTYHANCAIQLKIEFVVPSVPKTKKEAD